MVRVLCWLLVAWSSWIALAGERVIDFNRYPLGQTPAGFQNLLTGQGQMGDWKVIAEPVEAGADLSTNHVLAQLSQDGTDERFPLLVFDEEVYGDFTLTTKFKLMQGVFEQMAGIAFRLQDTNNYYYVRASALGSNFRFIKLVNGQRLSTIGPTIDVERGVWHDLKIDCKGNHIICQLDGKDVMPALTDNTFLTGRIAFWTKSDAVSCFGETKITYTLHETLAEVLVREALRRYPRLVGVRLYFLQNDEAKVIASNHADEVGTPGGRVEADVIKRGVTYFGKEKRYALVTLPLHDKNGEVAPAVRVILECFPGQTEQNAIARAQPVVKDMEKRVRTGKDLLQ